MWPRTARRAAEPPRHPFEDNDVGKPLSIKRQRSIREIVGAKHFLTGFEVEDRCTTSIQGRFDGDRHVSIMKRASIKART
jgi:hypothetical protein